MKTTLAVLRVVAVAGVLAGMSAVAAQAQVAPYAMFDAGHYSGLGVGPGTSSTQSGGITSLGGIVGVYDDAIHAGPVRLGPDFRLVVDNSSNSTPYGNKLLAGLVGLRLDAGGVPVLPFNPYIQAEIGGAGTNNGTSSSRSGSFAYQVQIGSDFTLFPHLAARLEYGAGQLTSTGGNNHTLQTFGAGLVVKLF